MIPRSPLRCTLSATLLPIPVNRFLQSLIEGRPGLKAKILLGLGDIQAPPWLAVRLGRVPSDLARKARQLCDLLGQVLDADLTSGPEIDRLGAVVVLGGQQDSFRRVGDVEEFTGDRA